ncbi:MAG: ABC transporter substrate-binding protein [Oscillospiraceae bacterium]|jgi:peptide/nickel transport system substrate-binding protein|nr:ABC transporter substrate-binding protein [Oscillospiraceae bacterium]
MKKTLSLALALLMLLALLAACSSASPSGDAPTTNNDPATGDTPDTPDTPDDNTGDTPDTPDQPEGGRPTTPSGSLIVYFNGLDANMMSGWGNAVGNAAIKELLGGYSTVAFTRGGEFIINPTSVKNFEETVNDDGSHTYTIEINPGLVYNDGTEITAKDYVFSFLFSCHPAMGAEGLESDLAYGMEIYTGALPYINGEATSISGLHLLDTYKFSFSIDAETDGYPNFPYWYSIVNASVGATPYHVYAPGVDVVEGANGAELTGVELTAELLQTTINDPTTGQRYNPSVTDGPYQFVSYDSAASQATLKVNPNYIGNYEGTKPMIETLVIYQAANATLIDEFRAGSLDLITGLGGATNINAGLDAVEDGSGSYISFPRNGYGLVVFRCDHGPTQFEEVRRAIAYCLDREELVRQFTGGFGSIVNSRYGAAQWMYQENKDLVEDTMISYTLNLEKAVEELVAGGWTLNETGGAYESGIRYKQLDDGTLMPLIVEMGSPTPAQSPVSEMFGTFLLPNALEVGMQINQDMLESEAYFAARSGEGDKAYGMMNGGTGFATADSPWYYYDTDPTSFGQYNSNFIADQELYDATMAMQNTESGDKETYFANWMKFVTRFNKILPDIPLYADEYHDFFKSKLKGYERVDTYPVAAALIDCWIEE